MKKEEKINTQYINQNRLDSFVNQEYCRRPHLATKASIHGNDNNNSGKNMFNVQTKATILHKIYAHRVYFILYFLRSMAAFHSCIGSFFSSFVWRTLQITL